MNRPRALVIDAGLGNIGSIMAALERHDCTSARLKVPPHPDLINEWSHVLLPGVGAFTAGMKALEGFGWSTWIKEIWCQQNRPLLGICLGMQLLASKGTEGASDFKSTPGLNLISGDVKRININTNLVLPHVGWNSLYWDYEENPLAKGIPSGSDMYFVHSYTFKPLDKSNELATCDYGQKIVSVVGCGSIYGVQFHPEKSQRYGHRLIKNFLGL